jgi:hypothetical protein
MSAQLAVAVISAVVALVSILLSANTARSTAVLQVRLQDELEQRREQASKASRLEEVISRYRDPLLNAAFDLQSGYTILWSATSTIISIAAIQKIKSTQ